ncbi:endonuclease/exonuclease/phosphatase family protein [Oceanisphaera sp. IT1-181]|uniref:endonuclease/exonuclease/phosphatase family protein n=1 Tax=Oceanisphaera sp. IT1-181 TaxID=3081199 RepID=UPI0029CA5048|nr:endonuclease/exonuclease/phosphatase family protein [Oceanisphaera sp. IT1-181]
MNILRTLRRYSTAAIFAVCGVLLPTLSVYASDIVVGSWNIQRLGHGSQKSFAALATIASKVDLLAVQEVMTEDGIAALEQALEKHSGEPWSHLVSHAIGSSSYKEMYAFLWRESAVSYQDGAVVYLDKKNHFIREPFSARFKSKHDNSELAMGTVHILYGKGVKDRVPEIQALADYWLWMKEVYPNTPLVLAGDFNLDQAHKAWAPLKQFAQPLLTSGASTLSEKPGKYANLYDNIWIERDSHLNVKAAGIIDFPKLIGWDHSKSRTHVSDHAPIYMALGNSQFDNATASLAPFSANTSAPQTVASRQTQPSSEIRGNRNSQIFHRSDCPSYHSVSEKNRVSFNNAQAAIAAGYRIAKNCP